MRGIDSTAPVRMGGGALECLHCEHSRLPQSLLRSAHEALRLERADDFLHGLTIDILPMERGVFLQAVFKGRRCKDGRDVLLLRVKTPLRHTIRIVIAGPLPTSRRLPCVLGWYPVGEGGEDSLRVG